jgi:hypothetical protein
VVLAAAGRGQNHTPGPGYQERAQVFTGSGGDVAGVSVSDLRATSAGPVPVHGSFPANVDWAVIALEIALPSATP